MGPPHSADSNASFRTLGRTRINTLTGKIFETDTGTSGTKCASALCRGVFGNEARFANVINISHSQNGILTMFVSGSNPFGRIGGKNFAPNLDLQLRLNLTDLTGTLIGDQFPFVDVFARGAVGNTTLLHSFDPQADRNFGPYNFLPGLGTRPMGDF